MRGIPLGWIVFLFWEKMVLIVLSNMLIKCSPDFEISGINNISSLCTSFLGLPLAECHKQGDLNNRHYYCLTVLEATNLKSRCWQNDSFSGLWGKDLVQSVILASGSFGHSLACRWCSLCVFTSLSLHACLPLAKFVLFIRTQSYCAYLIISF